MWTSKKKVFECEKFNKILKHLIFMKTGLMIGKGGVPREQPHLTTAPNYIYPPSIDKLLPSKYDFDNKEFKKAMITLSKLKKIIPSFFELNCASGEKVYQWINEKIENDGFDCIHQLYPFGVLAHRLYDIPLENLPGIFKPFSWQAYWSLLSRGFYSETISGNNNSSLDGIWAVEPHIGALKFGIKFEEMLYVKNGKASWLSDMPHLLD